MTDVVNLQPDVDQIKSYVSVGPTPDLSVTVHKRTFDNTFIVITIVFGTLIIAVIIVAIIWSYRLSKLPPPPPGLPLNSSQLTINTNYGAAPYATYPSNAKINAPDDGSAFTTIDDCLSQDNTKWVNDYCICETPFFGPTCSREKHDSKYFAVGIHNDATIGVNVINEVTSDGKSFNASGTSNSCSDHCNKIPDCIGFIYNYPDTCALLSDHVIIPAGEGISYSHDIDPTLYMKSSDNLHFERRVFLAESTWAYPSRYWLFKESNGYVQLQPNIVTKIDFFPEHIKMFGQRSKGFPIEDISVQLTGIYCLYSFNIDSIPDILEHSNSNQCYVHKPGTSLNIPPDWRYKTPIYVIYI